MQPTVIHLLDFGRDVEKYQIDMGINKRRVGPANFDAATDALQLG